MPKKSKSTEVSAETPEAAKPRRRPRSTPSNKKAATKRPPAARKPKAKAAGSATTQPTDEEVRLRAYFIAERRHRLDLAGDADSDWLEAKRQLLAELGSR